MFNVLWVTQVIPSLRQVCVREREREREREKRQEKQRVRKCVCVCVCECVYVCAVVVNRFIKFCSL